MTAGRAVRGHRAGAGLVLLALLALAAAAGPALSPWAGGAIDFAAFGEGPSRRHWLGTTQHGRDVLTVTLEALRRALLVGLAVAALSTVLAVAAGVAAGLAGGWADRVLMCAADLLLVLPPFLVVAVLPPGGAVALVAVLAAFTWMITARMVRATTRSLCEREYVLAARLAGVSGPRLVVRHVLPGLGTLLAVDASGAVGAAIIAETGLAWLGFGIAPPEVSLGTLVADGHAALDTWPTGFAAGLLVLAVLAVNLLGDGLREILDRGTGGR